MPVFLALRGLDWIKPKRSISFSSSHFSKKKVVVVVLVRKLWLNISGRRIGFGMVISCCVMEIILWGGL